MGNCSLLTVVYLLDVRVLLCIVGVLSECVVCTLLLVHTCVLGHLLSTWVVMDSTPVSIFLTVMETRFNSSGLLCMFVCVRGAEGEVGAHEAAG